MKPHAVSTDEVAVLPRTSRELGPDYDDAVAASLTEHLGRAASERAAPPPAGAGPAGPPSPRSSPC